MAAAVSLERKGLGVGENTSPCAIPLGALAARRLEPRGSVAGFTGYRLCRRPPRMNRVSFARVCSSFSLFLSLCFSVFSVSFAFVSCVLSLRCRAFSLCILVFVACFLRVFCVSRVFFRSVFDCFLCI